jgi:hypothetical protein
MGDNTEISDILHFKSRFCQTVFCILNYDRHLKVLKNLKVS